MALHKQLCFMLHVDDFGRYYTYIKLYHLLSKTLNRVISIINKNNSKCLYLAFSTVLLLIKGINAVRVGKLKI